MPHEIGLELAIKYFNLGEKEEAVQILSKLANHPIVKYWLAFLTDDQSVLADAVAASPELVYPYRNETAEVLKWAVKHNKSWKTKYYLAILNWSRANEAETAELFSVCGTEPDYAPFYLTRGDFYKDHSPEKVEADYLQALSLDNTQWRTYHALVDLYITTNEQPKALKMASQANKRFPENYITGFDYAGSLYYNDQYATCLKVLKRLNILPNEGARSGHDTYRNASVRLAIQYYEKGNYSKAIALLDEAREWPENLGVGRPYETDERIEDFLQSLCYKQLGNKEKEDALKQRVADYTLASTDHNAFMGSKKNSSTFLGAFVIRDMGQKVKADQIMKEWLEGNEKDKIAQWAMAAYSGNLSEARMLAENMRATTDGTPWNPSRHEASFELVHQIYFLISR